MHMEMKETRLPDNMKHAMSRGLGVGGQKHGTLQQCATTSNEQTNDTQ